MIWRLLRKNISIAQILGYALANLVGLAIVLSALRFYNDVSAALNGSDEDESLISKDYLVVSAPVSTVGSLLGGRKAEITEVEIAEIEEQPWALDVGKFTAADFQVTANVNFGGSGLSSFLFLESIPDRFIDIKPKGWSFDPEEGRHAVIPIILSKDYLSLYNFGFASSRGLPQVGEEAVSMVPIYLSLSGNGHYDYYEARVVGFSSRLNTIAVPQTFMDWANERYSGNSEQEASRLIVKVKNPGDPAIMDFMEANDYEVAGDKVNSGRASYFLTILTGIVVVVGLVICLLALFILLLSLHLLLQKNKEKIHQLLLLGYSPSQVSVGYYRLVAWVNASVLMAALVIMFAASAVWEHRLSALDIRASSPLVPIFAGVGLMAVITAVNFLSISRTIKRNYHE